MCIRALTSRSLQRPKEGIRSLGTRVEGGSELLGIGAGNELWSFSRAVSILSNGSRITFTVGMVQYSHLHRPGNAGVSGYASLGLTGSV